MQRLLMTITPINFYPRPPRGGRLISALFTITFACISIHALREEGDRPEDIGKHSRY